MLVNLPTCNFIHINQHTTSPTYISPTSRRSRTCIKVFRQHTFFTNILHQHQNRHGWQQNHYVGDFFEWRIFICHQHLTSVTKTALTINIILVTASSGATIPKISSRFLPQTKIFEVTNINVTKLLIHRSNGIRMMKSKFQNGRINQKKHQICNKKSSNSKTEIMESSINAL